VSQKERPLYHQTLAKALERKKRKDRHRARERERERQREKVEGK
jgi:hypothetical protein